MNLRPAAVAQELETLVLTGDAFLETRKMLPAGAQTVTLSEKQLAELRTTKRVKLNADHFTLDQAVALVEVDSPEADAELKELDSFELATMKAAGNQWNISVAESVGAGLWQEIKPRMVQIMLVEQPVTVSDGD